MNARQQKFVVGLVALVALGGGITAFLASSGPATAGDLLADDGDAEPTATPDMAGTDAAYDYRIDAVEECGETCRDVTATLVNRLGVKPRGFPFLRRDLQTHTEIQVCP